jgi:ribosome-associated translation inhibitor RaiA
MHIQLNTDKNIQGDERLLEFTEDAIKGTLARFDDRVTRVEVHFADENGSEKHAADDKRCTLEARIAGHQPVAATHHAATVRDALTGAIHKLEKLLTKDAERELEKRRS